MQAYYLLFLLLMLLSIGNVATSNARYALAFILLFGVASLRGEYVDNDYIGYLEYYEAVVFSDFDNVEPSFQIIARLVNFLTPNVIWLFVIYSALGLGLKWLAIDRLTEFRMAAVLIFYSWFFLLWDMTQIRVAIAGALLLLSIPAISERRAGTFLILSTLAAFFHYSAIATPILYVLGSPKFRIKSFAIVGIVICLILYSLKSGVALEGLIGVMPSQLINAKLESYASFNFEHVNTFNYVFLCRSLFAVFLFAYRDTVAKKCVYFPILLKMYILGLFIHVAFSTGSGAASRLSELFLVAEIILIPQVFNIFRSIWVGQAVVLASSLAFLLFSLHYTKLLQPYYILDEAILFASS
jgi:hypothetical protein